MEQTSEEILKSLKDQKRGKVAVTATAGWLSLAALAGLIGGVALQNRALGLCSLCWLGSGMISAAAAKETQDRQEIERRIEFVLRASALKREVDNLSTSRPSPGVIGLN